MRIKRRWLTACMVAAVLSVCTAAPASAGAESADGTTGTAPWDVTKRKELYRARLAALEKDDADGRFGLALWCEQNGLKREARAMLDKVLAIDADHEGARTKLGHRKVNVKGGEVWLDEKEQKRLELERKALTVPKEAQAVFLKQWTRAVPIKVTMEAKDCDPDKPPKNLRRGRIFYERLRKVLATKALFHNKSPLTLRFGKTLVPPGKKWQVVDYQALAGTSRWNSTRNTLYQYKPVVVPFEVLGKYLPSLKLECIVDLEGDDRSLLRTADTRKFKKFTSVKIDFPPRRGRRRGGRTRRTGPRT